MATRINDKETAIDHSVLLKAASAARENAYAPFSGFRVGAALQARDGQIFTGCNIENATLGLTMCAERVALFKAISEGNPQFSRIAVVADTKEPTPPCGACRQLLWEFGRDIEVVLGNPEGEQACYRLKELFPQPFDQGALEAKSTEVSSCDRKKVDI